MYNPYSAGFPIRTPKLPYTGDIPSGVQPGKRISISGTVQAKADDFRIDFLTPQNFIALHINPRFKQNAIVRNTDRGGWGAEERDGPFPFKQNQPFDMIITVNGDCFKVVVNGQHIFDYRHRIPMNEVTRLAINGGVDIRSIVYSVEDIARTQVNNPPVPSTIPIAGGLQPGKVIQIQGQVPANAGRFAINLQSGGSSSGAKDISLHFNPRFDSKPIVVRNSLRGGNWGTEDRTQDAFPFKRGSGFEILVYCDVSEWKVAVDGKHFISYPHQLPLKLIDHIGLDGDVVVTAVRQFN